MATSTNLDRARAAKARKAEAKRQADVRHATRWLHALRAEAAARRRYVDETEPRARERYRKAWLNKRAEWAALGHNPTDNALREVRKLERSDR